MTLEQRQAVIKAILRGKPDPISWLRDLRVKTGEEQVAESLEGNWQPDLLFVLKREQDGYEFCQKQMAESDQLAQYLQQREEVEAKCTFAGRKRKGRRRKRFSADPEQKLAVSVRSNIPS